jgi:ribonucleoside-diphosphate reductase alpha chain
MDWDLLRSKVKKYGIRNATLMALMPSETSSQLSNETNGIEPPRAMVSIKGSKEGVLPQIVPEFNKLGGYYQTLWNVETRNYLKTIAILQKYIDQAISVNTSYDPTKRNITIGVLLSDLLFAHKLGHKTLYYNNTRDDAGDETEDDGGCDSGACKI